jgi:hypothetical protein
MSLEFVGLGNFKAMDTKDTKPIPGPDSGSGSGSGAGSGAGSKEAPTQIVNAPTDSKNAARPIRPLRKVPLKTLTDHRTVDQQETADILLDVRNMIQRLQEDVVPEMQSMSERIQKLEQQKWVEAPVPEHLKDLEMTVFSLERKLDCLILGQEDTTGCRNGKKRAKVQMLPDEEIDGRTGLDLQEAMTDETVALRMWRYIREFDQKLDYNFRAWGMQYQDLRDREERQKQRSKVVRERSERILKRDEELLKMEEKIKEHDRQHAKRQEKVDEELHRVKREQSEFNHTKNRMKQWLRIDDYNQRFLMPARERNANGMNGQTIGSFGGLPSYMMDGEYDSDISGGNPSLESEWYHGYTGVQSPVPPAHLSKGASPKPGVTLGEPSVLTSITKAPAPAKHGGQASDYPVYHSTLRPDDLEGMDAIMLLAASEASALRASLSGPQVSHPAQHSPSMSTGLQDFAYFASLGRAVDSVGLSADQSHLPESARRSKDAKASDTANGEKSAVDGKGVKASDSAAVQSAEKEREKKGDGEPMEGVMD